MGQISKLNKENQIAEIERQVRMAWASFGKLELHPKKLRYFYNTVKLKKNRENYKSTKINGKKNVTYETDR